MAALLARADDVAGMPAVHGNARYRQIAALEITCTEDTPWINVLICSVRPVGSSFFVML